MLPEKAPANKLFESRNEIVCRQMISFPDQRGNVRAAILGVMLVSPVQLEKQKAGR
jgi:hypothetical protein